MRQSTGFTEEGCDFLGGLSNKNATTYPCCATNYRFHSSRSDLASGNPTFFSKPRLMTHLRSIALVMESEIDVEPFFRMAETIPGLTLHRFRSGEEALRILRDAHEGGPNLIVVTYDLPMMNGGALVSQLWRLPLLTRLPAIVIVPPRCDQAIIQQLLQLGPIHVIEGGDSRAEWFDRVDQIFQYWGMVHLQAN